ncbi:TfuA-like protein [Streptomyces sp. NPDC056601]|uniref:TfuA-like protein n=1 Tax=Streptomyces sp. NPDC056601 TaxID=3345875 RepID=UPI0036CD31CF
MGVHVFTGPTAAGPSAKDLIPSCHLYPPAQHGDFFRHEFSDGDVVVLIDGLYHAKAPIRHKEILETLSSGAIVIGSASMGALRAAELHEFGMIGVGRIFEQFRDGTIEADDEVAVLHSPGPEWEVLSDALVNMRFALQLAQQAAIVSSSEGEALLEHARSLHYARRSWRAVQQECAGNPSLVEATAKIMAFQERQPARTTDLKFQDALEGLRYARRIYEGESPNFPHGERSWPGGWRTTYLRKWQREFTGSVVDGQFVSDAAHYDVQRLFGQDQVARWRRFVLSAITGLAPDSDLEKLEEQACETVSKECGYSRATDEQVQEWLTQPEQDFLTAEERFLSVIVRSSRMTPDLRDPELTRWLLPQKVTNAKVISSSLHTNERVLSASYSKHTDHLKPAALERHMRLLWELDADATQRDLDVAAWDRGFADAQDARERLRPFFLKSHSDRRSGA